MTYPEKQEQLANLIVFLLSKGIISRAKCAKVLGISLVDLSVEYDEKINEQIKKDLNEYKEY